MLLRQSNGTTGRGDRPFEWPWDLRGLGDRRGLAAARREQVQRKELTKSEEIGAPAVVGNYRIAALIHGDHTKV